MSTRIVTDSSCDLPQGVADALGIVIVPLSIRFGDDEYIDRTTITTDRFWQLCSSSKELPQTAAPSPGQFLEAFRDLKDKGATGIVVISLSSSLSFTMESAVNAAKEMEGQFPIRVIDSRNASLGVGLIAVECAERARAGDSLESIVELANSLVPRTHVFGALDTLENLRKGGRIGGAKAMLGTALSVKPLIEVRNGEVEEAGKQRTRSKALAALIETLRDAGKVERLGVLHAQCPDIDDFVAKVREVYDGDIMIGDIGAVIGTHAGQGTIGLAFRTAQ